MTTRRRLLTIAPLAGVASLLPGGTQLAHAAASAPRTGLDFSTEHAFSAVISDIGSSINADADNLNGILSWQTAYVMHAYLQMFVAHRKRDYLSSFITWADIVLTKRDSELGTVDYRGLSLPGWSRTFPSFSDRMHQTVETGMIARPLALFARLVLRSAELRADGHLLDRAITYRDAAAEALAVHDVNWIDHRGPTGIYGYTKGMPHPYDGTECPFNMNHTLGTTALHLAATSPTDRGRMLVRSRRIARLHINDCRPGASGAYVWNYQWTGSWAYRGWTEADGVSVHEPSYPGNPWIEDVNHGALTAEFVADCGWDRTVYQAQDQTGVARAINNAVTTSNGSVTVSRWLDGTGAPRGAERYFVGTWAALAASNPAIRATAQLVSDSCAFTGITSYRCAFALSVAYLNRAASNASTYDRLTPID